MECGIKRTKETLLLRIATVFQGFINTKTGLEWGNELTLAKTMEEEVSMADFSPTRTHATWKPRVTATQVPFYHCPECGAVVAGFDSGVDNELINDGERSLIIEPSYAHFNIELSCCGKPMEKLEPIPVEDVTDRFTMNYQILGGMNSNAVKVDWKSPDSACKPRWFALKTFTGIMTKYVQPKKWPPILFALADEDAFAYCAKDPCIECTFRCKRGMEIYAYVDGLGLVCLPLDRMAPPASATFKDIEAPIEHVLK